MFQIMRTTFHSYQRLLVLSLLLGLTVSAQSPAYTDGQSAQLTEARKTKLFKLKTAIAVPTYIPAGFQLEDVTTETEPSAPGVCSYFLKYGKGKGEQFVVQAANDGIGSVDMKKEIKGRNPYFEGTIVVGLDEDKSVFAEWIGSKKPYQPKGTKYQMFCSLTTAALSRQEALKVMQSLRYLKK
ncbi:MAG TPA: hypothetical protein VFZ34_31675 [Blastocatellia bacterium]|nr:hypothetical protein [Blastocatellia bacterium]